MPRYFIEVAYKGTHYSGFQVQPNAITIQKAIETALFTFYKTQFVLLCSSRTDAGVHALQNFFHTDTDIEIVEKNVYNLNALLPNDITIKRIFLVKPTAHARFDADSRRYKYFIIQNRSPFLTETAWFYPFAINFDALNKAAKVVMAYTDFTSFSKRKTQVKTFDCSIEVCHWIQQNDSLVFEVKANRFLRGMVRGLVGTMLQVGRGLITIADFKKIIEAKDCTKANFTTPALGLFLVEVNYPESIRI